MTAVITTTPAADVEAARPARYSRALRIRRGFLIASPVLAGIFCTIGAYADPAAGISGHSMLEIYAANPEPLQFKSLGFHWGYAFWIAPALLIAAYVRGKGAWIANLAAFLGFAGMTTLPGLLAIDWFDSAVGQLYGPHAAMAVQQHVEQTMWGLAVFTMPGMIGFVLGLPLAAIALWRARLVRWWAPLAVIAAFAAFTLSNVTWWGCLITTAFLTAFAVALAQATRRR
jgi:hypothetical protein